MHSEFLHLNNLSYIFNSTEHGTAKWHNLTIVHINCDGSTQRLPTLYPWEEKTIKNTLFSSQSNTHKLAIAKFRLIQQVAILITKCYVYSSFYLPFTSTLTSDWCFGWIPLRHLDSVPRNFVGGSLLLIMVEVNVFLKFKSRKRRF